MKPVRWGAIGLSSLFLKRVLPPLQKDPLIDLVAIASRDLSRARAAAAERGIEKAFGSYEELIADSSIEAVYIPLPNHLHLEWICKAADAGKHIICEKPLTLNAEEAQQALDYAASKNVRLMEAFMFRFHPLWVRAREIVASGRLGELHTIYVNFFFNLKDPRNIRNIPEFGGGCLLDIGCYAVSAARYLYGRDPERVISFMRRDPEMKIDVLSSGILDFGRGRLLFTVGIQSFPVPQRVEVVASGGAISIPLSFSIYPDTPAEMTVTESLGTRVLSFDPADSYGLEFRAFSEALREDLPVPTPPGDAVSNMKVLDALFRSEQSGLWESV